jgi:hypothetical protein
LSRREPKKPKQPPFILLDHNVQSDVAVRLEGMARFRQIGEKEKAARFERNAKDHEIYMGPRRFLFVTHDRGFLDPSRLPGAHGGVLVLKCPENRAAVALHDCLAWWGPRRNLLRNRVFELTETGGVEVLRSGEESRIYRGPSEPRLGPYSALAQAWGAV